jgi:hypothetical protein
MIDGIEPDSCPPDTVHQKNPKNFSALRAEKKE